MQHRILLVIPTLDRSGAEKQLTLLACGLPREEFEVYVCALTRGGPLCQELQSAGVPVTVIHKRGKIDLRAYRRLKGLVASLRPDLIHTWLFAGNVYGRLAGMACGAGRGAGGGGREARSAGPERHPPTPIPRPPSPILVAGERCVDSWKSWLHLWIDRRLARATARIVANSPGVRDFYVGHGLPPEKFEVIPNGVLPAPASPASRQEVLADLGLPAHSRLVGLVGRLWPQKRIKDAIWAADLLKVIRGDVHLLVIGDGPHRARLEKFRDQVEIRDKVHFLGTQTTCRGCCRISTSSGPPARSRASPTRSWRRWPRACRSWPPTSPARGTWSCTALPVIWWRRRAGRPVRRRSTRRWRRAWPDTRTSCWTTPRWPQRIGQAARQRMLDEFSVEKMVERYADLYRRLLA